MGACVLCGKSAGLFYSLHKQCYAQFQSQADRIVELLSKQLEHTPSADLARQSQHIVQQLGFVEEAQQRALVRALETYAKQNFLRKDYTLKASIAWVELLGHLDIDQKLFLDANFIIDQKNLPIQAELRTGKLPSCNCNSIQFPQNLQIDEDLWWRFAEVQLDQLQPQQPHRRWTIAYHILESCLPSKTTKAVQQQSLGEGTLWLTNYGLYFETGQELLAIAYHDIYALTPKFDGVVLQSKQLQARPQTFRCADGKLLYQFLRFAQTATG